MWIIEINFAGRQFTHRVPDPRQRFGRFTPRNVWRPTQLRNQHAA